MATSTSTVCRRKVRRHRLSEESRSRVEFTHPGPNGEKFSLTLLDVSSAGFSVALEGQFPDLEAGQSIDGVTLYIGSCRMQGDIMIIHVTHERGVCGALFYPAEDMDLIKLRAVMSGIEAAA